MTAKHNGEIQALRKKLEDLEADKRSLDLEIGKLKSDIKGKETELAERAAAIEDLKKRGKQNDFSTSKQLQELQAAHEQKLKLIKNEANETLLAEKVKALAFCVVRSETAGNMDLRRNGRLSKWTIRTSLRLVSTTSRLYMLLNCKRFGRKRTGGRWR